MWVWIVRVHVLILRSKNRSFAARKESGLQWALAGCERRGRGWYGGPAAGARHHFLSLIEPCPSPLLLVSHGLVCVGDVVGRLCEAE